MEIKNLLEKAKDLAMDKYPLESDEEINTYKDIYGQIAGILENIEEIEGEQE